MRNLVLSPIFFACRYISPLGDESAFVLLSRRAAVIDREPATGPTALLRLQAISK